MKQGSVNVGSVPTEVPKAAPNIFPPTTQTQPTTNQILPTNPTQPDNTINSSPTIELR
jgi:hypothetical protein